ncbi:MAG: amylo-alpha-1,6-glucosidase [Acidobacteriota bacterium]
MKTIRIEREVCGRLEQALGLEWLETNGLGGFASSTITGANTRRYHGLLVAATKPPVGRVVMLSKFEETLVVNGQRYELSVNRYPGTVHPRGYEYLREFRLDPFPVAVYEAGGVTLEKRVFQVHGENTTVVEYEWTGGAATECALELRPLIAFRDYHSTTHANSAINTSFDASEGLLRLAPYGDLPAMYLAHNAGTVKATGEWYRNFEYARERDRGLDFQEDLFQPMALRYDLNAHRTAVCIASTQRQDSAYAHALRTREIERRAAVLSWAPSTEPIVQELTAAADQFLVERGDGETVIAGYHWFSDWGRDTMIALPGLTLVTGRHDIARGILKSFAASVDRGMLPNRFPDAGEAPEYNTVDATLWFFEAIRAFVQYSGDIDFVREHLYQKLVEILDWHMRGTRYGIHVDSDALLACGEPGVQLTWMDAKVGDWVVTPRAGKPVEIQALWYNALCIMRELSDRFGESERALFLGQLAARAKSSFCEKFWNAERGGLFDVVEPDRRDDSVRPNQIFAVSLHHPLVEGARARSIVELVQRELFTPVGLRTLSPLDARYRGKYAGGVWDRDSAYHQGTAWPWLMGPFLTAYVRVNEGSEESRSMSARWLAEFSHEMRKGGLGQISEVADGDAPHTEGGCIAQAWSVAELLRAAVEDVYGRKAACMATAVAVE